jgi:hypothetical protein
MVNEIEYDSGELLEHMQNQFVWIEGIPDDDKIERFISILPFQVKKRGVDIFDNFDRFTEEVTIETDFININRIEEFNIYHTIDFLIDKSLKKYQKNRKGINDSIYLKIKAFVKNEKIEGVSLLFYTLKIDIYEKFGGWDKLYILHSDNKIIGNELKSDTLFGKFKYEEEEINIPIFYNEYYLEIKDYSKLLESNTVEFSLRSEEQEDIIVDFQISEDTSNIFSSFQKKLNHYLSADNKLETKEISEISYSFNSVNELTSFEEYFSELEKFIENPAKKQEFLNKAIAWLEKNSDP